MYTQKINYGMTEEYFGLSTDTKPTHADNGDLLMEIDTGKQFRFDEQNGVWHEQPSGDSGGGGDGGSSDFVLTMTNGSYTDEETGNYIEQYSFDKTPADTFAAYQAGKTIKVKYIVGDEYFWLPVIGYMVTANQTEGNFLIEYFDYNSVLSRGVIAIRYYLDDPTEFNDVWHPSLRWV